MEVSILWKFVANFFYNYSKLTFLLAFSSTKECLTEEFLAVWLWWIFPKTAPLGGRRWQHSPAIHSSFSVIGQAAMTNLAQSDLLVDVLKATAMRRSASARPSLQHFEVPAFVHLLWHRALQFWVILLKEKTFISNEFAKLQIWIFKFLKIFFESLTWRNGV